MILSVKKITDREFKKYDSIDQSLITSKDFVRNFGEKVDYVEAHLYTQNGELIFSEYDFKGYTIPQQSSNDKSLTNYISFDPGAYIEGLGFTVGTYEVEYNILRKKIFNSNEKIFFIKEISPDRKEIRLSSNLISNNDIESGALNFIFEFQSSPYYKDFLLNFGTNKLVNAINLMLDKNTDPYSILIKLYQPLPEEFQLKDSCWIVEELSESFIYEVEIFPQIQDEKVPYLKGANFDIEATSRHIKPSDYVNVSNLLNNTSLSSYQKILNKLNQQSVQLNVDYSDYSDFVHFSSAKERLQNFIYKVGLLESYQSDIDSIETISNHTSSYYVSTSIVTLQNGINSIIEHFDGYEHFLYSDSHSYAYPKSGSFPYTLYPLSSSAVLTWLDVQITSASLYDDENLDNLIYTVPEFIAIDERNDNYGLFLNMAGQMFDTIWLYIRSMGDLWRNTNNLNTGISKDLVHHALQSLGIKIYNSKSNDDIFKYLLGTDSDGNYLPVTASYERLITSSFFSTTGEDNHKEVLKRIYHNVSPLLKRKGTVKGLNTLITAYGVPGTILNVQEYGGSDKSSENVEYSYDRFTYAVHNTGSSYIRIPWTPLTQNALKYNLFNVVPDSIEFRFQIDSLETNFSSSILTVIQNNDPKPAFGINLKYAPVNDLPYGDLIFLLSGSRGYISTSLSLPIYAMERDNDQQWWNVLLRRRYSRLSYETGSQYYDLFVKNEIGGRLGHQASASLYTTESSYNGAWSNFGRGGDLKYLYLGGSGPDGFGVSLQQITSSITSSAPIGVAATGHAQYNVSGTRIYEAGFTTALTGSYTSVTTNYWKNYSPANTTKGPMNRAGIWIDNDFDGFVDPLVGGQELVISFDFIAEDKTYYIGIAGDNYFGLYVNGTLIAEKTTISAPENGGFAFWNVFPVHLNEGYNIISFKGIGDGSVNDAIACEVYDNTLTELVNATDDVDLNIKFSSRDLRGGSIQITSCASGWVPVTTDEGVVCKKVISSSLQLTEPFIPSTFRGHFQEFRYWSAPLSESAFDKHVLNPESIQGNKSGSAYDDLAARFPFGNNLLVYNHYKSQSVNSVHPNQHIMFASGTYYFGGYGFGFYGTELYGGDHSSSFNTVTNVANFLRFDNIINYDSFTEQYHTVTPNSVYANPITEKVRIVNNTITGSVLSPFLRLEAEPDTELSKDVHLVDVSFSPQNEINKDIIAQFGNTINLDNLLGDPANDYGNSYPELTQLNYDYFKKFVALQNYRDYIRAVNFFDNSLFRMIKDYVPGRSNLLTGVTVKSHLLERPKVKRMKPVIENEEYTSSIDTGNVEAGSVYTSGYGDGSDFYTGELSGSLIDINDDFAARNANPYTSFIEDLNEYIFNHTDFNVLLNNVSGSRRSRRFKKINIHHPDILEDVDIQDSNYDDPAHTHPRYDGSKSTSKFYNVYTDGDKSYGKTAAIDYNVEKFAWISEVNEFNLNIYDKTGVNIKYLVDATASVIELTRENRNLFEVQNMFKSWTSASVALMDPQNPTNQNSLNGLKQIFLGGFSFTPIIYREINETLLFNYQSPSFFIEDNPGFKAWADDTVEWGGPGVWYNNAGLGNIGIWKKNGVLQNAPPNGPSAFSLSGGEYTTWPYATHISFFFDGFIKMFDGSFVHKTTNPSNAVWYSLDRFLPFNTGVNDGYETVDFISQINRVEDEADNYISFIAPRESTYILNVTMPFKFKAAQPDIGSSAFKVVGVIEKKAGVVWEYVTHTTMQIVSPQPNENIGVNTAESFVWYDTGNTWDDSDPLFVVCSLQNFPVSLEVNEELRVKFYFLDIDASLLDSSDIDIIIPASDTYGYFEVYDKLASTVIPITQGSIETSPPIFRLDTGSYKTLIFNDSASLFYNNTIFSTSGSSIADHYSDVESPFHFELYDLIRFGTYYTNNAKFYEIVAITDPVLNMSGSVPKVVTPLKITLGQKISVGDCTPQQFAILRKREDETSVILNFAKTDGKTSAGLLFPWNLLESIRTDSSNIIGPLKDKLLSKVLIVG